MEDSKSIEFLKLPNEIIIQIALLFPLQELCRSFQTCRQLKAILDTKFVWENYSRLRFGTKVLEQNYKDPQDQSWESVSLVDLKKLFRRLARTTVPSRDMFIIHMDNHYWKRIQSERCIFNPAAKLVDVWWFDVSTMIYGVPKGRYRLQWGCEISSFRFHLLEFRAIVTEVDEVPSWDTTLPPALSHIMNNQLTESSQMTEPGLPVANRPLIVQVPGEIVIEKDYMNVFVQIREHHQHKNGFLLDYVRLIEAGHPRPWDRATAASGGGE